MWDSVKHYPGLNGEIIGTWLWITGNTRAFSTRLKAAGFRFSANKQAWYYHEDGFRKRNANQYDLGDIRTMFGSQDLESETAAAIN